MGDLRMPIGIDDFSDIRKWDFYYVDKTGMIKELLNNWGKVNLFTRPRRFGKSLNMSMLQRFFEIGTDKSIFNGLAISKEASLCENHMGKYPVITLSLKEVNGRNYSEAVTKMWYCISYEASRLNTVYNLSTSNKLDPEDKELLLNLRREKGNLESSVKTLSSFLMKHCGAKCIVLIDEYDVPLQKAKTAGYYEEMVSLISNFFSSSLKSNDNVAFSVITGCLRIAKESIFTGFNNPKMHTIVDIQYDEWFGFTDDEVREMLAYYDKLDLYDTTKEWYDGYRFGDVNVYCPWDVINYCDQIINTPKTKPQNFWENTSGNDIIMSLTRKADSVTRDEIGALIEGGTVRKYIKFDITYRDLDESVENLWSVLFFTGYLTSHASYDDGSYDLVIPNKEVREIFKNKVNSWFNERVLEDGTGLNDFYAALDSEDALALEDCLLDFMADTISYYDGGELDEKENFYHGLLIGMLGHREGWTVRSNRESGKGRLDIVTYPNRRPERAYIIEIKYSKDEDDLEKDAKKALKQIEGKKYDNYFGRRKPEKIVHYGIAFCLKECRVLKG